VKPGVKPKIKSNTTLVVVLFAFLPGMLHASFWPLSDTLILDGEVVYIEPHDVLVNMDSLNQVMADDHRELPRAHYFTLAVCGGPHFGFSSSIGKNGNQLILDQFTEQETRLNITPTLALEAAWQWTPHLSVSASIGIEQWTYQWRQMDERTLAPDDDRFRFENRGDELWQFFTLEVGPGFEVDTTQVGMQLNSRTRTQLVAPISFRYMPIAFSPKSKWVPFVDLGVQFAASMSASSRVEGNGYYLAEDGSYSSFLMNDAERKLPSARVIFQAGVWWSFSPHWMLQAKLSGGVTSLVQAQDEGWKLTTRGVVFGLGIGRRISTGQATSRIR